MYRSALIVRILSYMHIQDIFIKYSLSLCGPWNTIYQSSCEARGSRFRVGVLRAGRNTCYAVSISR